MITISEDVMYTDIIEASFPVHHNYRRSCNGPVGGYSNVLCYHQEIFWHLNLYKGKGSNDDQKKSPETIMRAECDPYEYIVPEPGELIIMPHECTSRPEEPKESLLTSSLSPIHKDQQCISFSRAALA